MTYSTEEEPFTPTVEEPTSTYGRVHNEEMNLAWRFISETNTSVFLTGKAGTGKTTFLRKLRELTPKRMVVLAPTGVAAINAQGQTIHSFFQLPLGPLVPGADAAERNKHYRMSQDKKNLIRTLDLLVIDEVSMVRSDVLDAIDAELRKYRDRYKPFGGVQLLLIGDLQQLPPVTRESEWSLLAPYYTTPYFFGSQALSKLQYVTIELRHIYRQQDADFINILAKVRDNTMDADSLQRLNARFVPNFVPAEDDDWIRLTTHNRMAQDYNAAQLAKIDKPVHKFRAIVRNTFPESIYPADEVLELKIGAQVMFIKNDPSLAHEYYNGKIGQVTDFREEGIVVYCKEDNSHTIVTPLTWENTKFTIDPQSKDIREEVEGTFTQYPLRLAWAITVHKSQGLTFDHAVLDINESFAHGQVYVALSRCRTLEGLVLSRPLSPASVINDQSVCQYMNHALHLAQQSVQQLPQMRYEYYCQLLGELFDFRSFMQAYEYLVRVVDEHLYNQQPEYLQTLKQTLQPLREHIVNVGLRFQPQYRQMMLQSPNFVGNAQLQERIHAASGYFNDKLNALLAPVLEQASFSIENKTVSSQYNNALEGLLLAFKLKTGVYTRLADKPFSVANYLTFKAHAILDTVMLASGSKKKKAPTKEPLNKKDAKPKAKKGDSQRRTLELYRSGMSIEEIALERGLAQGTIESHLASFIPTGEVKVADFVSAEHQQAILAAVNSLTGSYTLSDVRSKLPEDISYLEIRLVLAERS
ncbi:MAG: helix-turn-helix domain-containing protein [Bacteroidaceae bacterium]|nr:helix-turn-helix domain-containing protein [Bacteroidaceae bacterium]